MFIQAQSDLTHMLPTYAEQFKPIFTEELSKGEAGKKASKFRDNFSSRFAILSDAMTDLLLKQENSVNLLTDWAARVRFAQGPMTRLNLFIKYVDQNPSANIPLVADQMSYLHAVLKGAEETLLMNGIEIELPTAQ